MSKAILLSDVKQVKDRYICFDEDYTCPLFNREKWKCQYRINTKTEDCPLRPLPERKKFYENDIDYMKHYKQGVNDTIDRIEGTLMQTFSCIDELEEEQ